MSGPSVTPTPGPTPVPAPTPTTGHSKTLQPGVQYETPYPDGDPDQLRTVAGYWRAAASELTTAVEVLDANVWFWSGNWDGKGKQQFVDTWVHDFAGGYTSNSQYWSCPSPATGGAKHPPRPLFEATIEDCLAMANMLEAWAHAIEDARQRQMELMWAEAGVTIVSIGIGLLTFGVGSLVVGGAADVVAGGAAATALGLLAESAVVVIGTIAVGAASAFVAGFVNSAGSQFFQNLIADPGVNPNYNLNTAWRSINWGQAIDAGKSAAPIGAAAVVVGLGVGAGLDTAGFEPGVTTNILNGAVTGGITDAGVQLIADVGHPNAGPFNFGELAQSIVLGGALMPLAAGLGPRPTTWLSFTNPDGETIPLGIKPTGDGQFDILGKWGRVIGAGTVEDGILTADITYHGDTTTFTYNPATGEVILGVSGSQLGLTPSGISTGDVVNGTQQQLLAYEPSSGALVDSAGNKLWFDPATQTVTKISYANGTEVAFTNGQETRITWGDGKSLDLHGPRVTDAEPAADSSATGPDKVSQGRVIFNDGVSPTDPQPWTQDLAGPTGKLPPLDTSPPGNQVILGNGAVGAGWHGQPTEPLTAITLSKDFYTSPTEPLPNVHLPADLSTSTVPPSPADSSTTASAESGLVAMTSNSSSTPAPIGSGQELSQGAPAIAHPAQDTPATDGNTTLSSAGAMSTHPGTGPTPPPTTRLTSTAPPPNGQRPAGLRTVRLISDTAPAKAGPARGDFGLTGLSLAQEPPLWPAVSALPALHGPITLWLGSANEAPDQVFAQGFPPLGERHTDLFDYLYQPLGEREPTLYRWATTERDVAFDRAFRDAAPGDVAHVYRIDYNGRHVALNQAMGWSRDTELDTPQGLMPWANHVVIIPEGGLPPEAVVEAYSINRTLAYFESYRDFRQAPPQPRPALAPQMIKPGSLGGHRPRVFTPIIGLYHSIDPTVDPPGWEFRDFEYPLDEGITGNGTERVITTYVTAPDGSSGVVESGLNLLAGEFVLHKASLDEIPRHLRFVRTEPAMLAEGTPLFAYATMRQMRRFEVNLGTDFFQRPHVVLVQGVTAIETILELAAAESAGLEPDKVVLASRSVLWASNSIVQSGGQLVRGHVGGGSRVRAADLQAVTPELLSSHNVDPLYEALSGFDIRLQVVPSEDKAAPTVTAPNTALTASPFDQQRVGTQQLLGPFPHLTAEQAADLLTTLDGGPAAGYESAVFAGHDPQTGNPAWYAVGSNRPQGLAITNGVVVAHTEPYDPNTSPGEWQPSDADLRAAAITEAKLGAATVSTALVVGPDGVVSHHFNSRDVLGMDRGAFVPLPQLPEHLDLSGVRPHDLAHRTNSDEGLPPSSSSPGQQPGWDPSWTSPVPTDELDNVARVVVEFVNAAIDEPLRSTLLSEVDPIYILHHIASAVSRSLGTTTGMPFSRVSFEAGTLVTPGQAGDVYQVWQVEADARLAGPGFGDLALFLEAIGAAYHRLLDDWLLLRWAAGLGLLEPETVSVYPMRVIADAIRSPLDASDPLAARAVEIARHRTMEPSERGAFAAQTLHRAGIDPFLSSPTGGPAQPPSAGARPAHLGTRMTDLWLQSYPYAERLASLEPSLRSRVEDLARRLGIPTPTVRPLAWWGQRFDPSLLADAEFVHPRWEVVFHNDLVGTTPEALDEMVRHELAHAEQRFTMLRGLATLGWSDEQIVSQTEIDPTIVEMALSSPLAPRSVPFWRAMTLHDLWYGSGSERRPEILAEVHQRDTALRLAQLELEGSPNSRIAAQAHQQAMDAFTAALERYRTELPDEWEAYGLGRLEDVLDPADPLQPTVHLPAIPRADADRGPGTALIDGDPPSQRGMSPPLDQRNVPLDVGFDVIQLAARIDERLSELPENAPLKRRVEAAGAAINAALRSDGVPTMDLGFDQGFGTDTAPFDAAQWTTQIGLGSPLETDLTPYLRQLGHATADARQAWAAARWLAGQGLLEVLAAGLFPGAITARAWQYPLAPGDIGASEAHQHLIRLMQADTALGERLRALQAKDTEHWGKVLPARPAQAFSGSTWEHFGDRLAEAWEQRQPWAELLTNLVVSLTPKAEALAVYHRVPRPGLLRSGLATQDLWVRAAFAADAWAIFLKPGMAVQDRASSEATLEHEMTHAADYYLLARGLNGLARLGWHTYAVTADLGVPQQVVDHAAMNPLNINADTDQARWAFVLYHSRHGAWAAQNRVIREEAHLTARRLMELEASPVPVEDHAARTREDAINQAWEDMREAFARYQSLPEEFHADGGDPYAELRPGGRLAHLSLDDLLPYPPGTDEARLANAHLARLSSLPLVPAQGRTISPELPLPTTTMRDFRPAHQVAFLEGADTSTNRGRYPVLRALAEISARGNVGAAVPVAGGITVFEGGQRAALVPDGDPSVETIYVRPVRGATDPELTPTELELQRLQAAGRPSGLLLIPSPPVWSLIRFFADRRPPELIGKYVLGQRPRSPSTADRVDAERGTVVTAPRWRLPSVGQRRWPDSPPGASHPIEDLNAQPPKPMHSAGDGGTANRPYRMADSHRRLARQLGLPEYVPSDPHAPRPVELYPPANIKAGKWGSTIPELPGDPGPGVPAVARFEAIRPVDRSELVNGTPGFDALIAELRDRTGAAAALGGQREHAVILTAQGEWILGRGGKFGVELPEEAHTYAHTHVDWVGALGPSPVDVLALDEDSPFDVAWLIESGQTPYVYTHPDIANGSRLARPDRVGPSRTLPSLESHHTAPGQPIALWIATDQPPNSVVADGLDSAGLPLHPDLPAQRALYAFRQPVDALIQLHRSAMTTRTPVGYLYPGAYEGAYQVASTDTNLSGWVLLPAAAGRLDLAGVFYPLDLDVPVSQLARDWQDRTARRLPKPPQAVTPTTAAIPEPSTQPLHPADTPTQPLHIADAPTQPLHIADAPTQPLQVTKGPAATPLPRRQATPPGAAPPAQTVVVRPTGQFEIPVQRFLKGTFTWGADVRRLYTRPVGYPTPPWIGSLPPPSRKVVDWLRAYFLSRLRGEAWAKSWTMRRDVTFEVVTTPAGDREIRLFAHGPRRSVGAGPTLGMRPGISWDLAHSVPLLSLPFGIQLRFMPFGIGTPFPIITGEYTITEQQGAAHGVAFPLDGGGPRRFRMDGTAATDTRSETGIGIAPLFGPSLALVWSPVPLLGVSFYIYLKPVMPVYTVRTDQGPPYDMWASLRALANVLWHAINQALLHGDWKPLKHLFVHGAEWRLLEAAAGVLVNLNPIAAARIQFPVINLLDLFAPGALDAAQAWLDNVLPFLKAKENPEVAALVTIRWKRLAMFFSNLTRLTLAAAQGKLDQFDWKLRSPREELAQQLVDEGLGHLEIVRKGPDGWLVKVPPGSLAERLADEGLGHLKVVGKGPDGWLVEGPKPAPPPGSVVAPPPSAPLPPSPSPPADPFALADQPTQVRTTETGPQRGAGPMDAATSSAAVPVWLADVEMTHPEGRKPAGANAAVPGWVRGHADKYWAWRAAYAGALRDRRSSGRVLLLHGVHADDVIPASWDETAIRLAQLAGRPLTPDVTMPAEQVPHRAGLAFKVDAELTAARSWKKFDVQSSNPQAAREEASSIPLDALPLPALVADPSDLRILEVNGHLAALFGQSSEELKGKSAEAVPTGGGGAVGIAHQPGHRVQVTLPGEPARTFEVTEALDPAGQPILLLADVSERTAVLRDLNRQLLENRVSGMPGREALVDAAYRLRLVALQSRRQLGIVLVDPKGIKSINDQFSHRGGNLILRELSRRVRDLTSQETEETFAAHIEHSWVFLMVVDDETSLRSREEKLLSEMNKFLETPVPFDVGRDIRVPGARAFHKLVGPETNPETIADTALSLLYSYPRSGLAATVVPRPLGRPAQAPEPWSYDWEPVPSPRRLSSSRPPRASVSRAGRTVVESDRVPLDAIPAAVGVIDPNAPGGYRVVAANSLLASLLGRSPEDLIGASAEMLLQTVDGQRLAHASTARRAVAAVATGRRDRVAFEVTVPGEPGRTIDVVATIDPASERVILVGTDVTAYAATERRLRDWQQTHPISGMPNEEALMLAANDLVHLARKTRGRLGVLVIDLAGFRSFVGFSNESGNLALREVGQRLTEQQTGMAFHLLADTFALLLTADDEASLTNRANELVDQIDRLVKVPIRVKDGPEIRLTGIHHAFSKVSLDQSPRQIVELALSMQPKEATTSQPGQPAGHAVTSATSIDEVANRLAKQGLGYLKVVGPSPDGWLVEAPKGPQPPQDQLAVQLSNGRSSSPIKPVVHRLVDQLDGRDLGDPIPVGISFAVGGVTVIPGFTVREVLGQLHVQDFFATAQGGGPLPPDVLRHAAEGLIPLLREALSEIRGPGQGHQINITVTSPSGQTLAVTDGVAELLKAGGTKPSAGRSTLRPLRLTSGASPLAPVVVSLIGQLDGRDLSGPAPVGISIDVGGVTTTLGLVIREEPGRLRVQIMTTTGLGADPLAADTLHQIAERLIPLLRKALSEIRGPGRGNHEITVTLATADGSLELLQAGAAQPSPESRGLRSVSLATGQAQPAQSRVEQPTRLRATARTRTVPTSPSATGSRAETRVTHGQTLSRHSPIPPRPRPTALSFSRTYLESQIQFQRYKVGRNHEQFETAKQQWEPAEKLYAAIEFRQALLRRLADLVRDAERELAMFNDLASRFPTERSEKALLDYHVRRASASLREARFLERLWRLAVRSGTLHQHQLDVVRAWFGELPSTEDDFLALLQVLMGYNWMQERPFAAALVQHRWATLHNITRQETARWEERVRARYTEVRELVDRRAEAATGPGAQDTTQIDAAIQSVQAQLDGALANRRGADKYESFVHRNDLLSYPEAPKPRLRPELRRATDALALAWSSHDEFAIAFFEGEVARLEELLGRVDLLVDRRSGNAGRAVGVSSRIVKAARAEAELIVRLRSRHEQVAARLTEATNKGEAETAARVEARLNRIAAEIEDRTAATRQVAAHQAEAEERARPLVAEVRRELDTQKNLRAEGRPLFWDAIALHARDQMEQIQAERLGFSNEEDRRHAYIDRLEALLGAVVALDQLNRRGTEAEPVQRQALQQQVVNLQRDISRWSIRPDEPPAPPSDHAPTEPGAMSARD